MTKYDYPYGLGNNVINNLVLMAKCNSDAREFVDPLREIALKMAKGGKTQQDIHFALMSDEKTLVAIVMMNKRIVKLGGENATSEEMCEAVDILACDIADYAIEEMRW